MNVLRRKPTEATPAEPEVDLASIAAGKKGRPTPKRRTRSQPPPPAPRTRKEAMAWQKERGSRAKVAGQSKMTTTEYREALKKGDPRVLPARDSGEPRALARDYVDSHRMASNYLLLLFPLVLIGTAVKTLQFLTLLLFVVLVLEWLYTGRKIVKLCQQRGIPLSKRDSMWSIGFYAGSRAYFRRSWRRPLPRVQLGEKI